MISRGCTCDSSAKGYINNISCYDEEKEKTALNHSNNKLRHPAYDDEQQQQPAAVQRQQRQDGNTQSSRVS